MGTKVPLKSNLIHSFSHSERRRKRKKFHILGFRMKVFDLLPRPTSSMSVRSSSPCSVLFQIRGGWQACQQQCQENPECEYFVFVRNKESDRRLRRSCTLKRSRGNSVRKNHRVAGPAFCDGNNSNNSGGNNNNNSGGNNNKTITTITIAASRRAAASRACSAPSPSCTAVAATTAAP